VLQDGRCCDEMPPGRVTVTPRPIPHHQHLDYDDDNIPFYPSDPYDPVDQLTPDVEAAGDQHGSNNHLLGVEGLDDNVLFIGDNRTAFPWSHRDKTEVENSVDDATAVEAAADAYYYDDDNGEEVSHSTDKEAVELEVAGEEAGTAEAGETSLLEQGHDSGNHHNVGLEDVGDKAQEHVQENVGDKAEEHVHGDKGDKVRENVHGDEEQPHEPLHGDAEHKTHEHVHGEKVHENVHGEHVQGEKAHDHVRGEKAHEHVHGEHVHGEKAHEHVHGEKAHEHVHGEKAHEYVDGEKANEHVHEDEHSHHMEVGIIWSF
jgi:hypothetical protein